ncbi:MAG TPA: hypothetical protein VFH97_06705 [Gemmatimonadales bacterium]|nr:hypothetical protein [Gemmatimonadales bacterium]
MKATIDFDEALYRRLKIEAARRGRTVRELVAEGVRWVLGMPPAGAGAGTAETPWFGSLKRYAANAAEHDLAAMRRSVARARGASRS